MLCITRMSTSLSLRCEARLCRRVWQVTLKENAMGYLEELMRVENASWKERNGTSIPAHPPMEAFLRRYCPTAVRDRSVRMLFMRYRWRGGRSTNGDCAWETVMGHKNRV